MLLITNTEAEKSVIYGRGATKFVEGKKAKIGLFRRNIRFSGGAGKSETSSRTARKQKTVIRKAWQP